MYDQRRGKIGVIIVVSLAVLTAGVIGAFHFVSEGGGGEGNGSEIAGATDDRAESAGDDEGHESVDPATDGDDAENETTPENESETERQSTDGEGADSTDTATDSDRIRTDGGSDETASDTETDATGDDGAQSDEGAQLDDGAQSDEGTQSDEGETADDDASDDVEYPGGMQVELVDLPPQLDTEGRTLFGVAVRSETPESGEAVLRIDGEVVDSAAYTTEANDALEYAEGNVQLFAVDPDVEAGETYPVAIETDHGDRTFDIGAEEPIAP